MDLVQKVKQRFTNDRKCPACFQNPHDCNHEVNISMGVDHDNIPSFHSLRDEIMRKNIGGLMDVSVSEYSRWMVCGNCSFNHTRAVGMQVRIG